MPAADFYYASNIGGAVKFGQIPRNKTDAVDSPNDVSRTFDNVYTTTRSSDIFVYYA